MPVRTAQKGEKGNLGQRRWILPVPRRGLDAVPNRTDPPFDHNNRIFGSPSPSAVELKGLG